MLSVRCDVILWEGLARARPRVFKPGLVSGHLSCMWRSFTKHDKSLSWERGQANTLVAAYLGNCTNCEGINWG